MTPTKPLPKLLVSRLQTLLGEDYERITKVFSRERQGSLRINTLKTDGKDVFAEFNEKSITITPCDGIENAYLFARDQEYAIKGTRAFYDGKIYLQSISSMLPVLALAPESGESILDVCAAPGSKTTQLAVWMNNTGSITAIEQNQIRYDKLMHNCSLQGATIVSGIKMDALKYLSMESSEVYFTGTGRGGNAVHEVQTPHTRHADWDRILIDAPCSAEGRISLANEKTYGFWSLENIQKKAELQYSLLSLAYESLQRGGVLVYSTCTLAPEENE